MYKQITVSKNLTIDIAKLIVQAASQSLSTVYILYDNKKVNAKSIMGVLSLSMKINDTAFIEATGEDDQEVIDKIARLI